MAQENFSPAGIVTQVLGSLVNYGFNKAAIADQNYYNSPREQVKRLSEAGLNPNLIYGAIQPSTQTSIPDNNIGKDLGQHVIAAQQMALQRKEVTANVANTEADTKVKEAQERLYNEQTTELQTANRNMARLQEYIDKDPDSYYGMQARQYLDQYLNAKATRDLQEQQLEINRINQDLQETKFWQDMEKGQAEIDNINKDTDLKQEQINKLVKEGMILDEDLKHYVQRFLTQPTPWFADIIKSIIANKLGLDPDSSTVVEVAGKVMDEIKEDTEKTKEEGKRKFTAIYKSKYLSHDDKYTYKLVTSGPDKGKKIRIEQKTGHIEFVD